jgi:PAS domain S-box-containing protein
LTTYLLGIPTTVFLIACGYVALTLIRITRFRRVWTLIAISAGVVASGYAILLFTGPPTLPTQFLYFLTSVIVFVGLISLRPQFATFQTSIDKLNTADRRMQETRRTLENVLLNAPLIVFATDSEGIFTMSEGRALEALGLAPGEVVGQSAFEMYRDYPEILSALRSALAGEESVSSVDVVDRSYEVSYAPIRDARGKVKGVFGVSVDVSKRKQTEAQLRATKDRFRALLETTSDWAWEVDSDVVYTYSSPKVRDLLGYEPDELIGKTPFDNMIPEEVETVRAKYMRYINNNEPFAGLVNTCLHRDGHRVVLETSGVPIFDTENNLIGYRGIDRDITLRTRAAQELRKEKETAQMYLDIAGVIMVVINADRTVQLINRKGCEILGYSESEIVGKDWFDNFLLPDMRDEVGRGFEKLVSGNTSLMEYYENTIITRDGEEKLIAWHNTVIYGENDEIIGTLSSGSDITDRHRAERERQELETQLQHSQRMETIGTLAGGIAHDFNNILFPILGYTDLAMEDIGQDHPTYKNLAQVVKAGHRAKELVEQIMVFSRQMDRDVGPIHLHLIVREALKFIRASLPTTIDIQQNVNIDAGVVTANSTQIHHLLVNLCTNSAHSMRDTGGMLRVELQPFEVDEATANANLTAGSYARLSVSDTGPGMDEQTKERMFEPFFTTRAVGEGTGLGLSVVHGIVASHNGIITVDSKPNEGTTVTVYFPTVPSEPLPVEIPEEVDVTGDEYVLFVDDEQDILNLGKHMLEKLGYRVTTASHGEEALEVLKAQPMAFDIVVTDQTMPRKTGVELTREIRKIRPDLPVIVITGYSEKVTPEVLAELNISCFLMKPLVGKKIGAAIRRALNTDS